MKKNVNFFSLTHSEIQERVKIVEKSACGMGKR